MWLSEQTVIEAEVHRQLRAFLRHSGDRLRRTHLGDRPWPHHLTLARLVARALRLRRGCVLQVTARAVWQHCYGLSYLLPALLYPEPVLVVVPEQRLATLLHQEIPELLSFLAVTKSVQRGDRWPVGFTGVLVMSLEEWVAAQLGESPLLLPEAVVTLIDGLEELPRLSQQHLTCEIGAVDWEHLKLAAPAALEQIRHTYAHLAHQLFQRPSNPYGDYLLAPLERQLLQTLLDHCSATLPPCWQQLQTYLGQPDTVLWSRRHPTAGYFSLHSHPLDLRPYWQPVWRSAPFVLIGSGPEAEPPLAYLQHQLAIPPQTTVKFGSDRHSEAITLYIAEDLPLPNTPDFAAATLRRLYDLIGRVGHRAVVVIVSDVPLREQLATQLAALYGSRVQLDTLSDQPHPILVSSPTFWLQAAPQFPCPTLLVLTTLPLPSPEKALVSACIDWHKQQQQDWFRHYLLPECLTLLDRIIAPLRQDEPWVAILDRRLTERTYGRDILQSLSPYNRVSDRALLLSPH